MNYKNIFEGAMFGIEIEGCYSVIPSYSIEEKKIIGLNGKDKINFETILNDYVKSNEFPCYQISENKNVYGGHLFTYTGGYHKIK